MPYRLDDGSLFVPKPTQRLLELRTARAAIQTVQAAIRLIGRVIAVEFTHAPAEVTIYATDQTEKPIPTKGSTGRIVVQSGGKTAQAVLAPIEPNKLVAKLDAPLVKGAVVVVSTTFSDGHATQARFTVD